MRGGSASERTVPRSSNDGLQVALGMTLADIERQFEVTSGEGLIESEKRRSCRPAEAVQHFCTASFNQVAAFQSTPARCAALVPRILVDLPSCLRKQRSQTPISG